MTSLDLQEAAHALYGSLDWGWRRRLAKDLGVGPATVTRWASGTAPIDRRTELAIKWLLIERHAGVKP